ncbi:MAG: hypothetical protein IT479_10580 [Xanthomonadales bacterium]|nr:hypothetical protein [Xanthomonadales bacterium]MCC6593709.1 hypothetical protein [Xanthomonadales bacterium]MCE7931049.1 hypothetical protein [Xanthomonadales bacterium PRO6]
MKAGFALALTLTCAAALAQSQEDRALAERIATLTSKSDAGLLTRAAADGSVGIELAGRLRHVHLARGDDGPLRASCVGSLAEANRFLGRDLRSGDKLVAASAPPAAHDVAALHGMSSEEYAFYWSLAEQTKATHAPHSSTISIINADGAGEGFNSTVARAPEGGNAGVTLGQQRLNVFNRAADIWEEFLDSTLNIRVTSNFDPIAPCNSNGGVLGFAGPNTAHRDFANAPFASTWYPAALANKISASDLSAQDDIGATFNSDVDNACLGAGTRFYYGLDNATPAGTVNLLVVVLHELGHGLGFLSFTDEATGAYFNGFPDVWARFMFDRDQNATWFQMTQAQRQASAINTNDLLWDGANVRQASDFLIAALDVPTGRVQLFTPNPLQPGSSISHWNSSASPNLLMEPAINVGLPLTLDLTRQLMRDIGWFRDANDDAQADSFGAVTPSGTTIAPGSQVAITWVNPPGFSRNVTLELSTNGGASFATTIASGIANTGSFNWTVPNTPTTQGRIRVREHNFVAPAAISAVNFTIGSSNTAPSFTPAAAISRQRGSPAGAAVVVGTVSDAQTAAGSLTVTQIMGGSATGVSASAIVNGNGTVSAAIAASCNATSGTLRFQVSDGSLLGNGDLQVNVSNNTPPVLTYAASTVASGAGGTITPATGPGDNGNIASIALLPQGTYGGGIAINPVSGVITLSNAGPIGSHVISVRAIDNCGANTDTSFALTVQASQPMIFANGFE